jgi:hypothetical protein
MRHTSAEIHEWRHLQLSEWSCLAQVCSAPKAYSDAAFLLLAARKECEELKEEIRRLREEGLLKETSSNAAELPDVTRETPPESVTMDKAPAVSRIYWILAHVLWQLICVAGWLLITS